MSEFKVEPYASFGSGEPWVARALLQLPALVGAVPAFAETRQDFELAQGEVFEALGMAFEALRKLRRLVDAAGPALEIAEAYASLYGYLWQAYKDRFQKALAALGVDFGFFWNNDAKFEAAARALRAERPELGSLLDLMGTYRATFHNALAHYRNTYLEHRDREADPQMMASFHRLEAAEETFENVWRAIEAIVVGLIAANLPPALAVVEVPEEERDPARPERFRIGFVSGA